MLGRVVVEREVAGGARARPGSVPSGKDPRAGVDVRFRERAHAHGEQLHQLACEVLLRLIAEVGSAIQPVEHRRILRHGDKKIPEIAEGVLAKQLELSLHAARILGRLRREHPRRFFRARVVGDLRVGCREMVVPEERHLLLQRPATVHQPEQPALTGIGDVRRGLEAAARGHAHVPCRTDEVIDVVRDLGVVEETAGEVSKAQEPKARVLVDFFFSRTEARTAKEVLDFLFALPHGDPRAERQHIIRRTAGAQ